jgi:hypothetical protein
MTGPDTADQLPPRPGHGVSDGSFRWRSACPGVRRGAARAGPGRGLHVWACPVRRRGTGLVRRHGPIRCGGSARRGRRAALEAHFASAEFDPQMFTPADHAALSGAWSWIGTVVGQALESDQGGTVDEHLAYVARGDVTAGRYALPSCSCTALRTGSCPARTVSGWPGAAARRSCDYAQMRDTSRSSAPAWRPWTGSESTPIRAEAPKPSSGRAKQFAQRDCDAQIGQFCAAFMITRHHALATPNGGYACGCPRSDLGAAQWGRNAR